MSFIPQCLNGILERNLACGVNAEQDTNSNHHMNPDKIYVLATIGEVGVGRLRLGLPCDDP